MEIKGKVTNILPKQSGVSKAGKSWEKQEFILEYQEGGIKRNLSITAMSDKIGLVKQGDDIKVSFIVESREYMGKWYTNATLQGIERQTSDVVDDDSGLPF